MVQFAFEIILTFMLLRYESVTTVRIDHIGISDKSIPPLCITVSSKFCHEPSFEKIIVVDVNQMEELTKFVTENKTSSEFNSNRSYEMGSFKITTLREGKEDISYLLDQREQSILYFNALSKNLSGNNDIALRQEINNLLFRINY